MRSLLLAFPLLALPIRALPAQEHAASREAARTFDHAVVISVDGLRSDALLELPPEQLPAFARLLGGASTLNARTDPDFTVTLPNHTGMLTGRPVLGERGHGWVENDDAAPGVTLHKSKGEYVAGIFDVAHDRGFRTALFAGKTKFALYDASWDGENGAVDNVGEDQGRDKIDEYGFCEKIAGIADGAIRTLKEGGPKSLVFLHFADTDLAAHAYGWDLTPGSRYLKTVAAVDAQIGRILDAIQSEEGLRERTAVIVTADHGGGAPYKSHDQPRMWVDYIIPFLVWTGDPGKPEKPGTPDKIAEKRDLYAMNAKTRADPGLTQPATGDPSHGGLPPIRNADAANLALSLLGLPPVPGSTINAKQDLSVFPAR
jgi:predicted AlkP superfamily pyrophosphatase or phosphodiesterase